MLNKMYLINSSILYLLHLFYVDSNIEQRYQSISFVKSDRPSKFPNLQIKYVRGLDPIIKLLDKDGEIEEVLAIEKWNTDSVEEFLNTHLESGDSENNTDYLRTNFL